MNRRQFLSASAASIAIASLGRAAAARPLMSSNPPDAPAAPVAPASPVQPLKGRIKHSVARWCYGGIELNELCKQAAAMGISSIEILDEPEWAVVASHGLTCAVANGPGSIPKGWNRLEHHDDLVARSNELLPKIAAAKIPNMIVFSGNRAGQPDDEGIRHCITGLKRITPLAESLGVTVVLEYLNSKVDHGDYQFDHMAYGVAVITGVASPRCKILFDIYHAQIMEGDIIRTIRDHIAHIGHFHTGGIPGRHEIDDTQELNYAAVCRAIADAGYTGFVAQEFVPTRDPLTSLKEAVAICDA
jgi:hydroxypyruvate isomerase